MTFQPQANQQLTIEEVTYTVAEHPAAPGMPYGQEGRQATVYRLVRGEESRALKVFKPRYRVPALSALAERLRPFAAFSGLTVCQRAVLTARRHVELLRQYPDLTYAVLMPWIYGPTWMEVMLERRAFTPEQGLLLARSLADVLASMEEHGLAHCDLSGPNVLLPLLSPTTAMSTSHVELVDVEQMYSSDLKRPEVLPAGSPGYTHRSAEEGLWGSTADRFAGAVLLAEMLGWCDDRVRETAWGESYFETNEMHQPTEKAHVMAVVLGERWGVEIKRLFDQAWKAEALADCPTFGEWLVSLPEQVPEMRMIPTATTLENSGTTVGGHTVSPGHGYEPRPEPTPTLVSQDNTLWAGASPDVSEATVEEALVPHLAAGIGNTPQLDKLYRAGVAAHKDRDWTRAKELLSEVVRVDPAYGSVDKQAATLLREATTRLNKRPQQERRGSRIRLVVPGLLLVLFLIFGGAAMYQMQATAEAEVRSQAAATTRAVQAKNTAHANASSTAKAAGTGTAQVHAQASSTAQTIQSTSTAQAQANARSTALALHVASSSTSQALAAEATATSNAQGTAVANTTGTAVAQAGETAAAQAAATAQAVRAATSEAMQQETATVEAQATNAAQASHASATAQGIRSKAVGETATARAVAASISTEAYNPSPTRVLQPPTEVVVAQPTQPPPGVIPVPQQITPPDGAVFAISEPIVFSASTVAYPETLRYRFQVVAVSGDNRGWYWTPGKTPLWRVISGETSCGCGGPVILQPGATYQWHIWAYVPTDAADWTNSGGPRSDASPWRTFTIRP